MGWRIRMMGMSMYWLIVYKKRVSQTTLSNGRANIPFDKFQFVPFQYLYGSRVRIVVTSGYFGRIAGVLQRTVILWSKLIWQLCLSSQHLAIKWCRSVMNTYACGSPCLCVCVWQFHRFACSSFNSRLCFQLAKDNLVYCNVDVPLITGRNQMLWWI